MAYLDVPHRPVLKRAGRENKASVGALGTLKIPFKLGMREWVTKDAAHHSMRLSSFGNQEINRSKSSLPKGTSSMRAFGAIEHCAFV